MQGVFSIEESKPVKERSSKTPAKGAEASKVSKDSDKKAEQSLIDVEASVHHGDANESEQSLIADDTVREDQTFGQDELKTVNEYLKGKVGADINAKKWLEGCQGLDDLEKSEVIIRLVYEVCLAKNMEYDLENDAIEGEKGSKRDRNFDTRRVFEILKKVNRLLLSQDRRRLVEFVCQKGNVKLLEMICQQEAKGKKYAVQVNHRYPWKEEFTGYERLIDLLQYVLKEKCSSEIVLCIAKKVYGNAHIFYNGKQYLDSNQVANIKRNFDYPDSVIKDCLKAAIELGYKDVVPVMLGGDIYHCIRLMKGEKFQEEKRFLAALKMIEETVAEVMSSWGKDEKQSFKGDVQRLLKEGVEIDIEKLGKQDLIAELEDRGIELSKNDKRSKGILVEKLKKEGGGKIRLSKTVVGGLISALFFNYQKELTEKSFELETSHQDKSRREKEIDELNDKIDSKSFVKEKVLEKIKSLNLSSHLSNNWFFREVLAAIINDEERLGKLQAVFAAICKEPMEELLEGAEVHEDVADALKIFGVEPNQTKTSTPKNGHSGVSIVFHFVGDIENLVKGIRELNDLSLIGDEVLEIVVGLASNRVPAFSGLSRRTIIKLKNKKDKTDDEAKDLKEKVSQIMGEIKRGIKILTDGVDSEYCIDIEDVFRHFKIINSEIKKEGKREIVGFVCQTGNVKLLEMICQQEKKDRGCKSWIGRQYPWKGEFTGYERLIDLLQYVLKEKCSSEIVLCIAKKVYGNAHIFYNGKQYLDDIQVAGIKGSFNYPDSVIKDCLRAAIELSYKDVVSVMLGGDIYHCIRLMEDEKFQEEKGFLAALKMIEETVAEVMSSWRKDEKQSFKGDVQRLLKEGIEIDIEKLRKQDLIAELEHLGIEVKEKKNTSNKELMKMLEKEGGGKVRLSKTVVSGLVSVLFFNYQKELTEKSFELKPSRLDESRREKEIDELNDKIDSKSFVKEKVLEKIKSLNLSSHLSNNWFFREVLAAIINDEERLGKLQAVFAAICKEPMQKLLKDVKVGEDVVDTLKFFGVDSLALEKSNVVANIPSLQIEDLTLSSNSRSEKGTSDELRQPSADAELTSDDCSSTSRDPLKINITGLERLAKANPVPLGPRVAGKKDEKVMQNYCGQGENSSYNKGENSHLHGGKVGSISRGLGMPRINFKELEEKEKKINAELRTNKLLGRVDREVFTRPPKVEDLVKANQTMYMKKTLDEFVLNYSRLSYRDLYRVDSPKRDLNESIGSGSCMGEDRQEFLELFRGKVRFSKYESAISELVNDDVLIAKKMLLDLVNDAVQPAYYAYALVLLKELVKQCDLRSGAKENVHVIKEGVDDIEEAVQLLRMAKKWSLLVVFYLE